ncbi:DNA alkylation repair protein [Breznakiella homolactica]|uniref:DNA alkylation repair protein n=1 Tax=Breznakiella homolactica TaxID=2798577 RepID=A0A7T7XK36_9SPIR|nr:DNA alkylation repair protein [Breznakiella homolactica]QQO07633.1 DNA alkylation repair protein [Breznakiella homolactica]
MPDLLKNTFNRGSLGELARSVQSVYKPFKAEEFLESTMDETWDGLELKARVRKISTTLGRYLPADYGKALAVLDKAIVGRSPGFFGIVFSDFVEVHGQDEAHWDLSIGALERYTAYGSSEFAVRPFIISHEKRMMAQMLAWSKHENEHVRRLASEGCRPRLPWGQALVKYKKDPKPILPILKQLKADPSPYVRKSVANNLNDIAKTHPDLVVKLAKDWYGKNEHTNWIIKHGCRTLLKKGNRDVLALFGYGNETPVDVDGFTLGPSSVSLGDDITFSFTVSSKEAAKVRLEYGIDYVKANGKRNRKIFQISEIPIKENEKRLYEKTHSFADLSTRKHYPGTHSLTLIVNGAERGSLDFELNL